LIQPFLVNLMLLYTTKRSTAAINWKYPMWGRK